MNALKDKIRNLINAAMASKSGPKRILAFDPNAPGRRLFPSDTPKNNGHWEIRLDAGERRKDNPNLVAIHLQINREAKTKGLKDLLKSNGTHHTYSTAWVDVTQPPTQAAADKLIDDLIENLEV
ncbi:hypothetical protein H112_05888 [Trichophyton rubrum D6]|uniref:Uncharacterized protein n=4 Tax=Trichophyton TaxID=5550 RepID=A0A178ESM6_TRIRU|nr:uncharacterized protein TERG_03593 [Trichophyton rubrum CBS 118892]EZF15951.1 hypothetical protein H100_05903 [Trichophyton rubrum MR850]EZF40079.1 hypothetical protein H102_05872 [Trichophyton rubrum CBS 100081]EZF50705.1 hypothetical protein H103_05899 [Trichophyton rubrum CBS 288.86]EZF61324.1 hypothetical protein H104_05885 [Trichophyton rubrum CBS 289.86]EZF71946.1 hypothetical protein H105_05914 [Trichophyton soudanense CBS 452.61]EZF93318.1 hypothetical protein H113_05939 [Trichophy